LTARATLRVFATGHALTSGENETGTRTLRAAHHDTPRVLVIEHSSGAALLRAPRYSQQDIKILLLSRQRAARIIGHAGGAFSALLSLLLY